MVNPLIVLLSDLRKSLLDMKDEICLHPRLVLPDDKDVNHWAYYTSMQVLPIVTEDFVVIILSILKSLYKWTSIKFITCPLFTLSLRYSFPTCEKVCGGTFAAIPTLIEIHICLATQDHLCVLNTALYPVEKIK